MNHDDFNRVVEDMFKNCVDVLSRKGYDYTQNDADRLKNFKEIASELSSEDGDVKASTICYVYMKKHWDAMKTWVKTGHKKSGEGLRETFTDIINYAAIMYCISIEMDKENMKTRFEDLIICDQAGKPEVVFYEGPCVIDEDGEIPNV